MANASRAIGTTFLVYSLSLTVYAVRSNFYGFLIVPIVVFLIGFGVFQKKRWAITLGSIFLYGMLALLLVGLVSPFIMHDVRNWKWVYLCLLLLVILCLILIWLIGQIIADD